MFKRQRTIKKRIEEELPKRCYQMGIPAVEQPKLCWHAEQFKWYTGYKRKQKAILGTANYRTNTILIDLHNHSIHKMNFLQIRNTLIHELVHMRWNYLKHGHTFRELIKRIEKGEVFPMRIDGGRECYSR